MPTIQVTGKADRRVHAILYEPRQTPEQDEVVLDEFDLEPGENRDVELRSATAGFRLVDIPGPVPEGFYDLPPDQAPGPDGVPPRTDEETQAGRDALSNVPETAETDPVRIARADQRRAADIPPRVERSERGRTDVPKEDKERREDRAARLTKGQEAAGAENPSGVTGSTGKADTKAEQAAATTKPSEQQLEANKASDAGTPPTDAAERAIAEREQHFTKPPAKHKK